MDTSTLFMVFKTAIERERKAYEFYQKASMDSSDPEIKKLFAELAKTELKHEAKLEKKYKELRYSLSGQH